MSRYAHLQPATVLAASHHGIDFPLREPQDTRRIERGVLPCVVPSGRYGGEKCPESVRICLAQVHLVRWNFALGFCRATVKYDENRRNQDGEDKAGRMWNHFSVFVSRQARAFSGDRRDNNGIQFYLSSGLVMYIDAFPSVC